MPHRTTRPGTFRIFVRPSLFTKNYQIILDTAKFAGKTGKNNFEMRGTCGLREVRKFNLDNIILQELMSSGSERSHSRRSRSRSREGVQSHKIFVTNLDGSANERELQAELKDLFDKYGGLDTLVVKKSRNGEYCFGFVEYKVGSDGEEAVRNLNGELIRGKPMKVEFQDNSKRRKDPDKGCYTCGRMGHFARECTAKNGQRRYRGRSRSRSRSRSHHKRKHRHRDRSNSSHRDDSRRKRDRKHKSKDREEKKKKKHKKHRKHSSSRS